MANDDRETFEALAQDLAEHTQRFPTGVSAEDARAMLAREMETVDHILADQPAAPLPSVPPAEPPAPSVSRREMPRGEMLLQKGADRTLVRKASPLEGEVYVKALRRIELLMTLCESGPLGAPSWRDRTLAVMQLNAKAAAWQAASEAPEQLAETRTKLAKDFALQRTLGLEAMSQLTPAFCRAKAAEFRELYLAHFCALLEDSNSLGFGSWEADPPPRIQG